MDNNEDYKRKRYRYLQLKMKLAGIQPPSKPITAGEKFYRFAQESVPYLAGAGAGLAGTPLGPEAAIPAAGLGYAGARSGLRGLGRMMEYEKPSTLGQELKRTALEDFPVGMAIEAFPSVIKNMLASQTVKRFGKGLADMFGTIPGVDTERIIAMFKKPSTLLPPFLGGPPSLREAGRIQGGIESRLGIPSLESEPIEPLYKIRPPKKIQIYDPEREGPLANLMKQKFANPKAQEMSERAIGAMKGPAQQETIQETAYRIHKMMTSGERPTVSEAVKALQGTNEALEKFPSDMTTKQAKEKLRLTLQAKRLQNFLSENVPELQKARANYAAAKTREAFTSPAMGLMAQSGGKDVSRMGANRLVGPFALYRMAANPAFGLMLGATQSPLVLGAGTAGMGALVKGLENRLAPYIIAAMIHRARNKKNAERLIPTPTQ